MTNEQINIAIAKQLGLTIVSDGITHCLTPCGPKTEKNPEGCLLEECPNYCNNLNAMHKAEKLISEKGKESAYWFFLRELLDFPDAESDWNGFYFFAAIHSTPLQKAEAFLKVFGKWEE